MTKSGATLSMTGFANATASTPSGRVTVDLRSVNHRYFEPTFRMPDDLRGLESQMRELASAKISRGKLDCRISVAADESSLQATKLDSRALTALAQLESQARAHFASAAALSMDAILRWPGIIPVESRGDALAAEVMKLFETCLADLTATRAREGEKLVGFIQDRLKDIEGLTHTARPLTQAATALYKTKLVERLNEALSAISAQPSEERIQQEVVMYASRVDVDEELDRLTAHVSEVQRVLKAGGSAGKRLDFLMQELNREANTLGSKSATPELTRISVELKVLIEQMREQVQNIE
jgi:uncharacterized protein (TIGR00255 family)